MSQLNGMNIKYIIADTGISNVKRLQGAIICGGNSGNTNATIDIHDGTSTAGTKILALKALAEQVSEFSGLNIEVTTGSLYVNISGTNANCTIMWE